MFHRNDALAVPACAVFAQNYIIYCITIFYIKASKNCGKMCAFVRLFVLLWANVGTFGKTGCIFAKKTHSMRTIRNIVSKETAKLIPTTVDGRREFLKRSLKQYEGRNVYCNALQNEVMITVFSLEETIHHACSTRKSTIAALNIIESIKHCEFDRCALPHSNRQKRKFEIIYLFKANIENVGSVQVVIGATFVNGFIHYCLTCKEK